MQKVQVQKFSVSLVQYEEKKDFNTQTKISARWIKGYLRPD